MLHNTRMTIVAAVVIGLSGCATKGNWMGAEAEKAYDKDLEAKRLAEVNNNDDYYEIYKDGRIYVLSDVKDYKSWLKTHEIPLVVTRIAAGPNGETVKMALIKSEAKAMEKVVGYKGGAQRMFEGELKGLDKGFFGFVMTGKTYYVFDNWAKLAQFKRDRQATGYSEAGPEGIKVVYVGAENKPEEMAARFAKMHDGK